VQAGEKLSHSLPALNIYTFAPEYLCYILDSHHQSTRNAANQEASYSHFRRHQDFIAIYIHFMTGTGPIKNVLQEENGTTEADRRPTANTSDGAGAGRGRFIATGHAEHR
jgi:hypothetical protein